jgi:membrane-associated phospholipid phosphatase
MTNIQTCGATDTWSTDAPGEDLPDDSTTVRGFDDDNVDSGRREAIAGGVMVGLVVLAALYFRWRPGPIFLDHWGFSLIHPALSNNMWKLLTDLRATSVLVGGSILAAVIVVRRDRWRALACLVAPTAAVVLTEYVLKPEIARRYAQVLSFPSGTTTLVSAVSMAFIVAVPRRIRPAVAAIAAFVVGLEWMAVIALQWHFPTDALGGVIFGSGMVLLVDGVLHIEVAIARRRRAPTPGSDAVPAASPGSS